MGAQDTTPTRTGAGIFAVSAEERAQPPPPVTVIPVAASPSQAEVGRQVQAMQPGGYGTHA
jgi:hypothetical protein